MSLGSNRSRNPTVRMNLIVHVQIMSSLLGETVPRFTRKDTTESIRATFDKLDAECREKGLKK